ncbi:MAG: rRNA pseudouridine synthase [Synergistaceae bacterium]|nr:rRNA pseudouridine synthase [Synergistaceae bacterium]
MNEARDSFPIRLNRYLAMCGVASRRKADELIASGRVRIGEEAVVMPGRSVNAGDHVFIDGDEVIYAKPVYIAMNKPRGVVSAVSDERERTVMDLLPERYHGMGIFPAGRLDMDSEGLIILTNDGKFANSIIHPSSLIKKTYLVLLRDVPDQKQVNEWSRGVIIEGKMVVPIGFSPVRGQTDGKRWQIVLGEGRRREIRLMAESLGNKVVRLKRIGIGRMFLKKLPSGAFCEYNYEELRNMVSNGGEV